MKEKDIKFLEDCEMPGCEGKIPEWSGDIRKCPGCLAVEKLSG